MDHTPVRPGALCQFSEDLSRGCTCPTSGSLHFEWEEAIAELFSSHSLPLQWTNANTVSCSSGAGAPFTAGGGRPSSPINALKKQHVFPHTQSTRSELDRRCAYTQGLFISAYFYIWKSTLLRPACCLCLNYHGFHSAASDYFQVSIWLTLKSGWDATASLLGLTTASRRSRTAVPALTKPATDCCCCLAINLVNGQLPYFAALALLPYCGTSKPQSHLPCICCAPE
jgi:hypothetical protein